MNRIRLWLLRKLAGKDYVVTKRKIEEPSLYYAVQSEQPWVTDAKIYRYKNGVISEMPSVLPNNTVTK